MQVKETTIGLIVLIVLFLVMLFAGSKLPPEIGQYRNWILLGLLICIALWFIFFIIKKILAVRSAMAIEKKLKMQASEQIAGARPSDAAHLQGLAQNMEEAMAALKTSKLGKSALYALPWYMIIGPPGTGKSTALIESGLNFPYTSGKGKRGAVQGVGGTRNCDWWFTDQGILLDTAGRYTTELEDRDEWLGFLDMLKRTRKDKPINGAIVCMAVNEVLQSTDEQLEEYAKKIRDRLDELTKRLELVFPVYLFFTKCDLINGFVEFFGDYTKADRSQVWGMTLPYQQQGSTDLRSVFEEECKKFYQRLALHRVQALASDRRIEQKRGIYSFPIEFAMTHKRLADFVGLLFRPNPYQESAILRGFYFTSGTQEGMPIDQIVNAIGASIPGIKDVSASFSGGNVDKKSYFINQLFTKVIFSDQNLARLSSRVVKTRKLIGLATVGLSALATVGISLILVLSFVANQARLRIVGGAGDRMIAAAKEPGDLDKNLKALDKLRGEVADLETGPGLLQRFGLNRDSTVLGPAMRLYFTHLQRMFLDPLGKALEKELNDRKKGTSEEDLNALFNFLMAYRILTNDIEPDAKDPELHHRILSDPRFSPVKDRNLWSFAGGAESEEHKKLADRQLKFYLAHFDKGPRITNKDDNLIAEVIKWLTEKLWIRASYEDVKKFAKENLQKDYPDITIEYLGSAKGKSYLKANYTFQGIFTQSGYNGYVKAQLLSKARDLARNYERLKIDQNTERIAAELLEMYKDEYFLHWNNFLDGIELDRFLDSGSAVERLKILSSTGDTAYAKLFEKVWTGRVLVIEGKEFNKPTENREWVPKALEALTKLLNGIQGFVDETEPGKRFQMYLDSPENKLAGLGKVFADTKKDLTNALTGVDSNLTDKVRRILTAPIISTRDALRNEARDEMNKLWLDTAADLWNRSFKDRYPFERDTKKKDVTMADFVKFFAPKKGTFSVIQDYAVQLNKIVIDQQPLLKFADDFKKAMIVVSGFGGEKDRQAMSFHSVLWHGEDKISAKFTITVLPPIGDITNLQIKMGGDPFDLTKRIEGGVTGRATLTWNQGNEVFMKITIGKGADARERVPYQQVPGEHWGLFRLMDALNIESKKPTEYALSYEYVTNTRVRFSLVCEDATNPFGKAYFSNFKFPEKVAGE